MTAGSATTVIIPAFNAAGFIAEALESAYAQSRPPAEIIVVDDGSTDDTVRVVRERFPDVRCLSQANSGPSAARNRGLSAATGDIVAWLDADDRWVPDKLELQVGRLLSEPRVDVVLGLLQTFVSTPDGEQLTSEPTVAYQLGAAVMRKDLFDWIGGFDVERRQAEDWDWFLRARDAGARFTVLDRTVYLYRRRPGSLTHQDPDERARAVFTSIGDSLRRRKDKNPDAVASLWDLLEDASGQP